MPMLRQRLILCLSIDLSIPLQRARMQGVIRFDVLEMAQVYRKLGEKQNWAASNTQGNICQ